MEENIFRIFAALAPVIFLLSKEKFKSARVIAQSRKISIPKKQQLKSLQDFFQWGENKVLCRRYFLEAPVILFLYRASIMTASAILLILVNNIFDIFDLRLLIKPMHAGLVSIWLFTIAAGVLAKDS
ncbi:MAG: hypothetical protein ACE5HI_16650 [bacterium]